MLTATGGRYIAVNMAPIYLVIALVIQCSFIQADTDVSEKEVLKEVLQKPGIDDEAAKDFNMQKHWLDMFTSPNSNMLHSPSAAMMAQVTNTNKTLEEQLKDIQELAEMISNTMKTEMVNLFSYAMSSAEKEGEVNGLRKRRSAETPMDSTEMVMRLLRHIKSNNENQNIAIEKMMTAKEIAEKFGIEFNPDPEILSDLAIAANEQAQEMTNMLKNACELKNNSTKLQDKVEFIRLIEEPTLQNETYFIYSTHPEEKQTELPPFEFLPEKVSRPQTPGSKSNVHFHYSDSLPLYNYPNENQLTSPPVHHHSPPVTPKPSFYDPFFYPYTPVSDIYSPYFAIEPVTSTVFIPIEDPEPEPELFGEEVDETITSKMLVERGDEPGSSTVNHVTTYTISEKSHFKTPKIEKLPQHFQYSFFLI